MDKTKKKMVGVVAGLGAFASVATMSAPPAQAVTTTKPLTGVTIALDAGHNVKDRSSANWMAVLAKRAGATSCEAPGTNTGTGEGTGYLEATFNWDVTSRLKTDLENLGAKVVLTRTEAVGFGPCLVTRQHTIDTAKPNLTVSIHADGAWGATSYGFHVIYPTKSKAGAANNTASKNLATVVRNAFKAGTGMPYSTYIGHGTALSGRSDLYLMNSAKVPTILVESGNMRNTRDAKLQTNAVWRQKEANAITAGIRTYLHK